MDTNMDTNPTNTGGPGREPATSGLKAPNSAQGPVEGLVYPVEFELRVIYLLSQGQGLAGRLSELLAEYSAALEPPRALPHSSATYGRLACGVRFENQEALYSAYAAIGALPGVKVVL